LRDAPGLGRVALGEALDQRGQVLAVLRETFQPAIGATKTEWRGSCPDVAERTFYHVLNKLIDKGHVKPVGTHYRAVPQ